MVLACAAPLALLIGTIAPAAWIIAPLLGLAVLLLIVADAMLAGGLADVRVLAPEDCEVGEATRLTVLADVRGSNLGTVAVALALDRRLADEGSLVIALAHADTSGVWQGSASITPNRRGTGNITALWLRWTGPLGLGARQHRQRLDVPIRVWPNIAAVRSPSLQTFLQQSQFGQIARRIRGEGSEFEALSEYQPGMDRRRIDWKSSSRHAQLYAREYEVERNIPIVFALDCGQAMCEPVAGLPRIDRAVSAALTAAYVALKGGDRVALFGFAARPILTMPFVANARDFFRLQRAAASLDYCPQEPNFTLALATLSARLQRRSLVVVFSDFTDPTSAELMLESVGRIVAKHRVIFVTMADAELGDMAGAAPDTVLALARSVTADALLRQRALVLARLRQLGVDVIEAPHDRIGMRLIDSYLSLKRKGGIG